MNRNFVEAIVSNMLVKQVRTYEQAVMYIRQQSQLQEPGAARSGGKPASQRTRSRYGKTAKPAIPIVTRSQEASSSLSQEEIDAARALARRLDGQA